MIHVLPMHEAGHTMHGMCFCNPKLAEDPDMCMLSHQDLAERHGLQADSWQDTA